MDQDTTSENLFFSQTVASYTTQNKRFLRRDWLANIVGDQLNKRGISFVLLIGEPGVGKTNFMAQLANDHPNWPRYFIRRNQRTPLSDVDAKSFLMRIGFQLAGCYPELFDNQSEQMRIVVEQQIGTVDEGGELVGAEIEKLLISPFNQRLLKVQQNVRQNKGRVVGLTIRELITDQRLLSVKDLFSLALYKPAITLKKLHPEEKIVVLVDALDEIHNQGTSEGNVLEWLTNATEMPDNLLFVLTSRPPEAKLNLFISKQSNCLKTVLIDPDGLQVKKDVAEYGNTLMIQEQAHTFLQANQQRIEMFVQQSIQKAGGNLGYLDALGRGIDRLVSQDSNDALKDLNSLLDLKELPAELSDLYAFFLIQIKGRLEYKQEGVPIKQANGMQFILPAWEAVYKPILGILAVAYDSLSSEQIMALGLINTSADYVKRALEGLSQFLDIRTGQYRLYHTTLAEFLTGDVNATDPKNRDLLIDSTDSHVKVFTYYRGTAQSWSQKDWQTIDNYGLMHLSAHLLAISGREEYRSELYGLLCKPFMREKLRRTGSYVAFSTDVEHIAAAAREAKPPDMIQLVKAGILITKINKVSSSIASEFYGLMTRLGLTEMALGYADMIQDSFVKVIVNNEIAGNLPGNDERRISLVFDSILLINRLVPVDLVEHDQPSTDRIALGSEIIINAVKTLLSARAFPQTMDALEQIVREDYLFEIMREISKVIPFVSGNEFQNDFADKGWNCIEKMQKQRTAATKDWLPVLVRAGKKDLILDTFAEAVRKSDSRIKIAQAFIWRGDHQMALDLQELIEDPAERVDFLSNLVPTFLQVGALAPAQKATYDSLTITQAMPAGPEKIKGFVAALLCMYKIGESSKAVDLASALTGYIGVSNKQSMTALTESINSVILSGDRDLIHAVYRDLFALFDDVVRFSGKFALNKIGLALVKVDEMELAHQLGEKILSQSKVESVYDFRVFIKELALLFFNLGDHEKTQNILDYAISSIDKITNPSTYDLQQCYEDAAGILARMGYYKQGMEFVNKIRHENGKRLAWESISESLIEANNFAQLISLSEEILDTAKGFEDDRTRQNSYCLAVKNLFLCGRVDRAWQVFWGIQLDYETWSSMFEVVSELIDKGSLQLAREIVLSLVTATESSSDHSVELMKGFLQVLFCQRLSVRFMESDAMMIAQNITDDFCRDLAYNQISLPTSFGNSELSIQAARLAQETAQSSTQSLNLVLGLALAIQAYFYSRVSSGDDLLEELVSRLHSLMEDQSQMQFVQEIFYRQEVFEIFTNYLELEGYYLHAEVFKHLVQADERIMGSMWATFLILSQTDYAGSIPDWMGSIIDDYFSDEENRIIDGLKEVGVDLLMRICLLYLCCTKSTSQDVIATANEYFELFQNSLDTYNKLTLGQACFAMVAETLERCGETEKSSRIASYVTSQPLNAIWQIEQIDHLRDSVEPAVFKEKAFAVAREIEAIPNIVDSMKAFKLMTIKLVQNFESEIACEIAFIAEERLNRELNQLDDQYKYQVIADCVSCLAFTDSPNVDSWLSLALDGARLFGDAQKFFKVLVDSIETMDRDRMIEIVKVIDQIDSWWVTRPLKVGLESNKAE